MTLDFFACDRGHKHATEWYAQECNRRAKLGQMMPPDDEFPAPPDELMRSSYGDDLTEYEKDDAEEKPQKEKPVVRKAASPAVTRKPAPYSHPRKKK